VNASSHIQRLKVLCDNQHKIYPGIFLHWHKIHISVFSRKLLCRMCVVSPVKLLLFICSYVKILVDDEITCGPKLTLKVVAKYVTLQSYITGPSKTSHHTYVDIMRSLQ